MTRYLVTVRRTEIWSRIARVEALNADEARSLAETSLDACGWEGLFPDNEDGYYEDVSYKVTDVEREEPKEDT